jgi:hypothetical protein
LLHKHEGLESLRQLVISKPSSPGRQEWTRLIDLGERSLKEMVDVVSHHEPHVAPREDRLAVQGRAAEELHEPEILCQTDGGVSRSDSVYEWLRRAGAGRVLNARCAVSAEIPLPRPTRSREWMKVALVECARCRQVVERTSPIQRHCPDCAASLGRERSRECVRRRRGTVDAAAD